jgi:hypothetical protein
MLSVRMLDSLVNMAGRITQMLEIKLPAVNLTDSDLKGIHPCLQVTKFLISSAVVLV